MDRIINLTQHAATPDQITAGVYDLNGSDREKLVKLLTFEEPPTRKEIEERAQQIAAFAHGTDTGAMIGGALWLMKPLAERVFRYIGIRPLFSFSKRESVEQPQPDGSVRKVVVFRHVGWVDAM